MKTYFKNARIYDTHQRKFIRGGMEIENGIITVIGNVTEGADLNGMCVIPGMVDVHTHGRSGYGFRSSGSGDTLKMCASYAAAGTTSLFATVSTAEYEDMIKAIKNAVSVSETISDARDNHNKISGASIEGIHIEGRFLNPVRKGAHNEKLLFPLNCGELNEMLDAASNLPVHITAAPELEGGEKFVKTAVSRGATVGIGHSDASYEQALSAISWGATSFTHTFNGMRGIHHREPGTAGTALVSDCYAELISDGHHIHPAVVKLIYLVKDTSKLVLITDSVEMAGLGDGKYMIRNSPVYVKDGCCRLENGTIDGSTIDLFTGMRRFAGFCGIPLEQAVPYATENPARMVGIYDKVGSLETGKRADFLVLKNEDENKNSDIDRVYINGILFK